MGEGESVGEKYEHWGEPLAEYSDARLLDLGCGGNPVVPYFAAEENQVVQADISRDGLKLLTQQHAEELSDAAAGNTQPVQGDGRQLPFQDDSFGVIWMGYSTAVGSSAFPIRIAQADIARVLRSGGDLHMVSGFDRSCYNGRDALHYGRIEAYEDAFEEIYLEDDILSLTGFQGGDSAPELVYSGDITADQLDMLLNDAETVQSIGANPNHTEVVSGKGYPSAQYVVEEALQEYTLFPERLGTGDTSADILQTGEALYFYATMNIISQLNDEQVDHHLFQGRITPEDANAYLEEHGFE